MQNEMDFYDHYIVIEYNHDFYIFLKPIISPVSLSSDNS